jgi:hypothetical protein
MIYRLILKITPIQKIYSIKTCLVNKGLKMGKTP